MKYSKETLRKAQFIMLEILMEVDRICQKYDIKYWLDSGTLLGAVRHKGFIPWDDDLDISMTLEDYSKFCEIAPKELPQDMFLQTSKTNPNFPYDIAKIRSNKGQIVEKHETNKKIKYNQGIFIDIIPTIMIKEKSLYRYSYKMIFMIIKLFSYKYLNIGFVRKFFVKLIDNFNNKNNNIMVRSGKFPSPLLYINKSKVFPLTKISFENMNFYMPKDFNSYLVTLYGKNYMNLPPIDKRVTHSYDIKVFNSEEDDR